MKSHTLVSRRILAEAGKMGLTPGQPKILDFLLKFNEADQKTIAAYCEIEPATAGSILLRMEDAGLILRRQKNGNRRSLYVSLTENGRDAATKLMEIFQKAEEEAISGLSEQEVSQLKETLGKICTTMQKKRECKKGLL